MVSVNRTARLAGALYLVIAAGAVIPHFIVPDSLIVAGNAAATAENIEAGQSLFRFGIGSELVVLLSEIVLSVLLYVLLKPVNKTAALIAAAARLAMTTIHGINLLNYFIVLLILNGAGFAAAFEPNQQHELVALFVEAHSYGFTLGIVFLTLHAVLLGWLILRSGYIPKFIGVLFLMASAGYLIDTTALLFVPAYGSTPVYIALPIAIAEVVFPLWLLVKGVKLREWENKIAAARSA